MYHITEQGDPGVCRAQQGRCPFGNPEEHFKSASEARHAYEQKMGFVSAWGSTKAKPKPLLDLPVIENPNDFVFNSSESQIDYTPDQVREKFERDIAGHVYALSSTTNQGEPGLILERLFGKEPDSDPTADLGSVELKTLKKASLGANVSLGALKIEGDGRNLRNRFLGANFQQSLRAGEWVKVGQNYYTLLVDRKSQRVRLIIANAQKEFVSTDDFGWDFSRLHKKVDDKLAHIAVGLYETNDQPNGSRTVTFDKLVLGGFTRDSMIDKLENGEVEIDFRFDQKHHTTVLKSRLDNFRDRA